MKGQGLNYLTELIAKKSPQPTTRHWVDGHETGNWTHVVDWRPVYDTITRRRRVNKYWASWRRKSHSSLPLLTPGSSGTRKRPTWMSVVRPELLCRTGFVLSGSAELFLPTL